MGINLRKKNKINKVPRLCESRELAAAYTAYELWARLFYFILFLLRETLSKLDV